MCLTLYFDLSIFVLADAYLFFRDLEEVYFMIHFPIFTNVVRMKLIPIAFKDYSKNMDLWLGY